MLNERVTTLDWRPSASVALTEKTWSPSGTSVSEWGESQGRQAASSRRHSIEGVAVAPASVALMAKVTSPVEIGPVGPESMLATGATSTVNEDWAGVGSVSPAATALTPKVCPPSGRSVRDTGDVQAEYGAASNEHSKVTAEEVTVELKTICPDRLAIVPLGAESIDVFGLTVIDAVAVAFPPKPSSALKVNESVPA